MSSKEYEHLYEGKNGCCKDHLGNYYISAFTMCDCWGVAYTTFRDRMDRGWSVEKSLTHKNSKTEPDKDKDVVWVFGEPFPSYSAVDRAYGYATSITTRHRDDLEAFLMLRQRFFVDGNLFNKYTELSKEYKIGEETIKARLYRGWSISDAVHKPLDRRGGYSREQQVDHLGNVYESLTEMLLHYGISMSAYHKRRRRGWSLDRILTTPVKNYLCNTPNKVARLCC